MDASALGCEAKALQRSLPDEAKYRRAQAPADRTEAETDPQTQLTESPIGRWLAWTAF